MRKGGGVSRRTKPAPAGAGMSEQRTLKRSAAERSEAEAHKNKKTLNRTVFFTKL
jgi:hypothetical protein